MESLPSTSTVQQDVTTAASSAEVVVAQLGDQCLAVSADAPRNSRKRSAPSSDDEEATATPPELHLYSYDDATRSGTAVVAASAQLVRAARTRGRGVLAKRVALRKVSNTTLDTRDATSPARSRSAGAAIAEQGPAASLVSNQRAPELAPKRTKLNHAGALSATGRRRYPYVQVTSSDSRIARSLLVSAAPRDQCRTFHYLYNPLKHTPHRPTPLRLAPVHHKGGAPTRCHHYHRHGLQLHRDNLITLNTVDSTRGHTRSVPLPPILSSVALQHQAQTLHATLLLQSAPINRHRIR